MSETALLEKPGEQPDGESGESDNKYLYPEFFGYSGERYLDMIVQQILPYALWRTWHHAVEFQAPGNVCYVGTARIASRVKPGIRKIEVDLQELEARGLMRRYADRRPVSQEDGSTRYQAVTVKDFSALYALAHEYHLWTHSDDYVPASRDQIELIRSNPRLLAKVLRFDNYRRLIECRKPGRKAKVRPIHLYYRCTRPDDEVGWDALPEQPQEEGRGEQVPGTPDQNANLYSNELGKTSAPDRESSNEETLPPKDSISSSFEGVGHLAIGNSTDQAIATNEGDEETESKSRSKEPNSPPQKETGGAERAKEVPEYNIEELKRDPFMMATALLQMRARGELGGQPPSASAGYSQPPEQDQRPRRVPPEPLLRAITMYAQQLGDSPKFVQSDITRATKIYFASTQIFSGFRNSWFRDQLAVAFAAACKRGIKKRMPYFFTTLENTLLELSPEELAYIRSDEPLYADSNISDFVGRLRQQYEKSGSALPYKQWIQQTYLASGSA